MARKWVNVSNTKTYRAWWSMRHRCYSKASGQYNNYGGRGIEVCPEWKDNYDQFFADMGECPEDMTLERDDVNGAYEKSNCRWATWKEQQNNRRNNVLIHLEGERVSVAALAERAGVPYDTMYARVVIRGIPAEAAVQSGGGTRRKVPGHGSPTMYLKCRCRCPVCVEYNRQRLRAWRAKKKEESAQTVL